MRAGTGRGTKKIWKTIKLQEYNSFSIQETKPAVTYKKGDDLETRKISTSQKPCYHSPLNLLSSQGRF
jgi:hypothetical protein